MNIYNDDCFNVFPKIADKTIDLFVLDLPYGQTACKWDSCIDLKEMWIQIKRIMKPNAVILFYCTTKFGYKLIQSNEKWFRYDLIWKKSRKVGFLSANKMPLRQHENIYVFSDADDDLDNSRNKELRSYAEQVFKFIGKNRTQIAEDVGNNGIHHFYSKGVQFGIPNEKNYNKLIEIYKIDEMEGFIDYKTLKSKWDDEMVNTYNPQKTKGKPFIDKRGGPQKQDIVYGKIKHTKQINKGDRHPTSIIEHENIYVFSDNHITYCKNGKYGTYNPQKTKGKPYKTKERIEDAKIYNSGKTMIRTATKDTTNRHPTSIYPETIETTILEHNNPAKSLHTTQKPTSLCEWLIKTYSNEGDVVMDFTMGSGTTGEACINTKRKFIGVEMDKEIFEIAENRLNNKTNK